MSGDVRLAGWGYRLGASLVDTILIVAVATLLAAVAGTDPQGREILTVLASVFYTVGMLTGTGRTLGNMVAGTRVVPDAGAARLPAGTAFLRWLTQILLGLTVVGGVLDALWPLWDARRQTLHDKVAATLVVRVDPLGL